MASISGFRILRGLGAPGDVYAAFLKKAIAKFPGYYRFYETALADSPTKMGRAQFAAMLFLCRQVCGSAAEEFAAKASLP